MTDKQETVKIHIRVGNSLYPMVFHRARFEQTMDRIDADIEKGVSFQSILKKYEKHIVSHGKRYGVNQAPSADKEETLTKAAPSGASKAEICAQVAADNPGKTLGELSKIVAANYPHISYSNARYLLTKLLNISK